VFNVSPDTGQSLDRTAQNCGKITIHSSCVFSTGDGNTESKLLCSALSPSSAGTQSPFSFGYCLG